MRWIQCFLIPDMDYVKYTTDELMPEITTLSYKEFLNFAFSQKMSYRGRFIEELNKYKTIIINTKTGVWEIVPLPDFSENKYSFDELYKIKEIKDAEKDNKKKDPIKILVEKSYNIFNTLIGRKSKKDKNDNRITNR